MRKNKLRTIFFSRSGLAFSELLIAIVILSLAMLPAMNMLFTFRTYTLHTEDVNLALLLANEKLEEYKHMSFRELIQFDGNQENGPVINQTNPMGFTYDPVQFKKFKRKVHIKTSFDGNDNKVMITVHVWWHDNMFSFNDRRFVKISALKVNERFF